MKIALIARNSGSQAQHVNVNKVSVRDAVTKYAHTDGAVRKRGHSTRQRVTTLQQQWVSAEW